MTIGSHRKTTTRRGASVAAVLVLHATLSTSVAPANHKIIATTYWEGGEGFWSQSTNWRDDLSPVDTAIPADVFIDESLTIPSYVVMDTDSTVHQLYIDELDQLCINIGKTLTFGGIANNIVLNNDGMFEIGQPANGNSANSNDPPTLAVWGSRTLLVAGSGQVLMHQGSIEGQEVNARIHFEQLIHGSGTIGNNKLSIDNRARIVADHQDAPLVIQCDDRGLFNRGSLEAIDGELHLLAHTVYNQDGQFIAGPGGTICFDRVTLNGGVLTSTADGRYRVTGTNTSLNEATLAAPLLIQSGDLRIINELTNDGRIGFDTEAPAEGGFIPARILLSTGHGDGHEVTLDGYGELRLDYITLQRDPALHQVTLVNGSRHAIRGGGSLGSGSIGIRNLGTIDASNPALTMTIQAATGRTFINQGTVRSSTPATLAITGSHFRNDGLVEVIDNGIMAILPGVDFENLSSTTLSGGKWRVNGQETEAQLFFPGITLLTNDAIIELIGEHAIFPAAMTLAANYGALRILDGHEYETQGFLTNAGELFIGLSSRISVNGDYTQLSTGVTKFRINALNTQYNPEMEVEGTASLAGIIQLDVAANGPLLTPGQEFTLIDADSFSLNPDLEVRGPGRFELFIEDSTLKARVLAGCMADMNGNGSVDTDDFGEFFQWWGPCPPAPDSCIADFDGDGNVGLSDFNHLLQSWGYCD